VVLASQVAVRPASRGQTSRRFPVLFR